jgi:hypothetical protein
MTEAGAHPASPARRRWLLPCAEIVAVGLPFCAFKILTGGLLLDLPLAPLGAALVALGAIDLALNLVNLVAWMTARRALSGVCLTEVLARRLAGPHRGELGLALDVLLSFSLVALVVGLGLLGRLSPGAVRIWNVAVVLNVLGAGIGRVLAALRPAPN